MTDRVPISPRPTLPTLIVLGGLLVLSFLTFLSLFTGIFGIRFYSLTNFADIWTPAFTGTCAFLSVLFWGIGFLANKNPPRGQRKLPTLVGVVSGPVFGFALSTMAFYRLAPMLAAFAVGEPMTISTEVDHIEQRYSGCRYPVHLINLPPLCSLPAKFRETLFPGDTLIIIGTGTAKGLFVSSIDKAK